ncbi:type I DNA topoisomerase [Eubacterium oxidoreducens]|uniref:DNA topoisomerase 1 n=1 Tax=Eubacterium oxidoreducens TaxID=1732 RepID=A0A1G6AQA4_EUBOX|nr:type I DNA topoisomerase [Eubacterium oxidoreducens]SDB10608.1 DNA topoisomerase-1 [Eubacterium oxidoreducens]
MAKYLVIVESPAKVKTIKKFLGKNYEVAASNGHVRDLPKSSLGIDVEHDFEPHYITIRGKGDVLAKLRKEVKKSDKVYLATDPDREGEAISWHLAHALKLEDKSFARITFNEITKNAVKESLKNPREINMGLVDAQQARRVLDRMVGYGISPLLWAKVKRGLSAGRVQSVALRIIADREEEVDAFIPEEYWTLDAKILPEGEKKELTAHFYGSKSKKMNISSKEEVEKIMKEIEGETPEIAEIKKSERVKKQPLPFTTSTLQQEASKRLNFSTVKTMRFAQQLYEGVDIKKKGTVALITYLRTDSTRVSEEAENAAEAFIKDVHGEEYVGKRENKSKNHNKIQDAHEAIRPTDVTLTPSMVKESLTRDQFRLYQLIWNRFMASRMTPAVYERTAVKIKMGEYYFNVNASKVKFDGFLSVYSVEDESDDEKKVMLKGVEEDTKLSFCGFEQKQHFTQPPAHYTEASLVRTLEELGIGRPSTYAPTISTILNRRYIAKEGRQLFMTELGEVVNAIMKDAFPAIVNEQFTANMESLLDKIEEGTIDWKIVVRNFYPDLDEAVKAAEKDLEKIEIEDEKTDVICEKCGANMVIKYGPHGRFLACPNFPDCRNTKPYYEKIGVPCPLCNSEVVLKKTKKGRKYYGCEKNPDCEFMSWQKPSLTKCPTCGGYMIEKGSKLVCADQNCKTVLDLPQSEK